MNWAPPDFEQQWRIVAIVYDNVKLVTDPAVNIDNEGPRHAITFGQEIAEHPPPVKFGRVA
jgi:hypothetical protein